VVMAVATMVGGVILVVGCSDASPRAASPSAPPQSAPASAPPRSAAEFVPDSVTDATLSGSDVAGRSYPVVLSPAQAHALAQVFNQLPTVAVPTQPLACAMGRTVNATFTNSNGRWDFVPNCDGIGVTFNGAPQPELDTSWDLAPVRDAYYAFTPARRKTGCRRRRC